MIRFTVIIMLTVYIIIFTKLYFSLLSKFINKTIIVINILFATAFVHCNVYYVIFDNKEILMCFLDRTLHSF